MMDLKMIEKKEEPLLSRVKLKAEINFDSVVPSNKDVRAKVASHQKASENLIVVKNISTIFGSKSAKITCYQYEDEKKLKLIEPKEKAKKAKTKEEPKKEEKK